MNKSNTSKTNKKSWKRGCSKHYPMKSSPLHDAERQFLEKKWT